MVYRSRGCYCRRFSSRSLRALSNKNDQRNFYVLTKYKPDAQKSRFGSLVFRSLRKAEGSHGRLAVQQAGTRAAVDACVGGGCVSAWHSVSHGKGPSRKHLPVASF